jgi:hypothetical protein
VTLVRSRSGDWTWLRDSGGRKVPTHRGAGVSRFQEWVVSHVSRSLAMSKYRTGEILHEN